MAQFLVIGHQNRDFMPETVAQAIIGVHVDHLESHVMPGQQRSQFGQHLVAQMALPAAVYSKCELAHGG